MKKILIFTFLFVNYIVFSQVGVGTALPNGSSQLDVVASDKGILIPRLALSNTTDATTITSGNVNSLLVFNTNTVADVTPGYYYWYVNKWHRIINADDLANTLIVSTLVNNGNGTFTYTDETGFQTLIDLPTFINQYETLTSTTFNPSTGILTYNDENNVASSFDLNVIVKEPWYNQASGTGATSNTQNIYQSANVAINKNTGFITGAALDVNGAIRGGAPGTGTVGVNSIAVGTNVSALGSNSASIGGSNNTVNQTNSLIGGGSNNAVSAQNSVVFGSVLSTIGTNNTYSGIYGGYQNRIFDFTPTPGRPIGSSAIIGGWFNEIQSNGNSSVILGGDRNKINVGGALVSGILNQVIDEGNFSIVGGTANTVTRRDVIAGGGHNIVNGQRSLVIGTYNIVSGNDSFAGGFGNETVHNTASGDSSIAFGYGNTASGSRSVAVGNQNISNGAYSFAGGFGSATLPNTASGQASFAFGLGNTATGLQSVVFGRQNTAGNYSFAGGLGSATLPNTASGQASFSFGLGNTASGAQSTAFGRQNTSTGGYTFTSGRGNTASSDYETVFGLNGAPIANGLFRVVNTTDRFTVLSTGNIGINTATPRTKLDVVATDAIIVPNGTTTQRPTAIFGAIRYNSTIGRGEMYVNDVNGDGTQGDAGWRAI